MAIHLANQRGNFRANQFLPPENSQSAEIPEGNPQPQRIHPHCAMICSSEIHLWRSGYTSGVGGRMDDAPTTAKSPYFFKQQFGPHWDLTGLGSSNSGMDGGGLTQLTAVSMDPILEEGLAEEKMKRHHAVEPIYFGPRDQLIKLSIKILMGTLSYRSHSNFYLLLLKLILHHRNRLRPPPHPPAPPLVFQMGSFLMKRFM